ncbi:hypothetical protein [Streptomyces marokkonensis]|uniref:hypothetical protein n=1 Tax=Streptomyces marokkonensis TaxID=324855 RepID=UPI00142F17DE|nr:hypothetical protein [Streptomyces marokkonensis]
MSRWLAASLLTGHGAFGPPVPVPEDPQSGSAFHASPEGDDHADGRTRAERVLPAP